MITPLALPSIPPGWSRLGPNPWGEMVWSYGSRRAYVSHAQEWMEEPASCPHGAKWARCLSKMDKDVALASLTYPDLLNAWGTLEKAWQGWQGPARPHFNDWNAAWKGRLRLRSVHQAHTHDGAWSSLLPAFEHVRGLPGALPLDVWWGWRDRWKMWMGTDLIQEYGALSSLDLVANSGFPSLTMEGDGWEKTLTLGVHGWPALSASKTGAFQSQHRAVASSVETTKDVHSSIASVWYVTRSSLQKWGPLPPWSNVLPWVWKDDDRPPSSAPWHCWAKIDGGDRGVWCLWSSLPCSQPWCGSIQEWATPSIPDDPKEEKVPYRPYWFPDEPSEAYITARLLPSLKQAWKRIAPVHQQDVQQLLQRSPVDPHQQLSAEQWDAVLLGYAALTRKQGFVLADETGFGKGRTLMAWAGMGLHQGRTVVVVTENAPLFSDLVRDWLAVWGDIPDPVLLHKKATVFHPNGDVLKKSLPKKVYDAMMLTKQWKPSQPKLIFTTYSQLNRAKTAKEKLQWLRHRMGEGAWLLLDEAHNAAGDSAVRQHIGELESFAEGVVYASATFAKHEQALLAYRRLWQIDAFWEGRAKGALSDPEERGRQGITSWLLSRGQWLRREHPPAPPPHPFWVGLNEEQSAAVQTFSSMWQHLFALAELWEQAHGNAAQAAWLKCGGALNRGLREFALLLKIPALLDRIEHWCSLNHKVVVAMESTFEAALEDALQGRVGDETEEQDDEFYRKTDEIAKGDGLPPLWRDRWKAIVSTLMPAEAWARIPDCPQKHRMLQVRQLVEAAIDSLPSWSLSPLDALAAALRDRSLTVDELSGRKWNLHVQGSGWSVTTRPLRPRKSIVDGFNHGNVQVLLLSRAGCTGISLHAGAQFQDQRPRVLIEWETVKNPVQRVQFWGRVRRRDQVCEPKLEGLLLDLPEERKWWEREEQKRQKLLAHQGESTVVDDNAWLDVRHRWAVHEWAQTHSDWARRLGLRDVFSNPKETLERALSRLLVLPPDVRLSLIHVFESSAQVWQTVSVTPKALGTVRQAPWLRSPWQDKHPVWLREQRWMYALPDRRSMLQEWVSKRRHSYSAEPILEYARRCRHPSALAWIQRWSTIPVGQDVQYTDITSQQRQSAVWLGMEIPSSPSSYAGLGLIKVLFWNPLKASPESVPALVWMQDPHVRSLHRWVNPELWQASTHKGLSATLEGDALPEQIVAQSCGVLWGKGSSESHPIRWQWPLTTTWSHIKALPREFWTAKEAFSALLETPSHPLLLALAGPHTGKLWVEGRKFFLELNASAVEAAQASWFHPQQKIGLAYKGAVAGQQHRWMGASDQLRELLHAMYHHGWVWRR